MTDTTKKANWVDAFLRHVERVGNALPHPASLFAIFAGLIVVISGIVSFFDISATHPGTGEVVAPFNLISTEGLHLIITEMVHNFTSFAPLGVVLVALLGIGVAEGSGLISSALRLLVISAPKKILTFVVVFAGILSNTASEVGYVVLVPLSAIIFLAVGRHPLAGLAAAFAGVSGGYSANLLLGTIDPLLSGLSQEAAQIIDLDYTVNPAANYYFMFASTFIIAITGTWITEKIIIPRLGEYTGDAKPEEIGSLSKAEKKGLKYALITLIAVSGILAWGIIPANFKTVENINMGNIADASITESGSIQIKDGVLAEKFKEGVFLKGHLSEKIIAIKSIEKNEGNWVITPVDGSVFKNDFFTKEGKLDFHVMAPTNSMGGFLRDRYTDGVLHSPFMKGIVALIFIIAALMGIAYGIGAGTVKNDSDVVNGMSKSMETLGSYIVLVFFAAQFVAYFKWTNLGLIFAINGASFLGSLNVSPYILMLGFIIITAIINMVMGSASAKWTIMAPVFIPMFMLLGYSPELTQLVYRIGDSVTNIISPMMSYFALIVSFMTRYDKKAGIGTIISTMLPYTIAFFVVWTLLLFIWMIIGLPIGPDSPVFVKP